MIEETATIVVVAGITHQFFGKTASDSSKTKQNHSYSHQCMYLLVYIVFLKNCFHMGITYVEITQKKCSPNPGPVAERLSGSRFLKIC